MQEQPSHFADVMAIPDFEHTRWQVEEVQQALREADEGAFASEDKVAAVLNKYVG